MRRVLLLLVVMLGSATSIADESGYFLIRFLPGENFNTALGYASQPGLKAHHAYQLKMHVADQLVMAGSVTGDEVGMAVIRTSSREEAEALVNADPGVVSKILRAEVLHWDLALSSMRFMPQKPMQPLADPDAPFKLRRIDSDSAINIER